VLQMALKWFFCFSAKNTVASNVFSNQAWFRKSFVKCYQTKNAEFGKIPRLWIDSRWLIDQEQPEI
jgi:hypothetical protein